MATAMESAERAMRACLSAGERPVAPRARARGSMTLEELAEWRRVPGNEGVRAPVPRGETAVRPAPVRPVRVCVRLAPVDGVPMLARATVAFFVDTHDREMAESVAEAAMHRLGLTGEVVS